MNAQQITEKVLKAIEDQDWNAALGLLTDDFRFSGAVPQPITAQEWLGVHRALAKAMPDLRFNGKIDHGDNSTAEGTVSLTGTNTGQFDVPIPGIPSVPATGKRLAMPKEPFKVTVRGDKLSSYQVTPVPDGGLPGILKQMGVTVPQH